MKGIFKKLPAWYTITVALGVVSFLLYLGYHDEGYNNWSWMQDVGSWIFMFISWNVLFWFFIGIGVALRMIKER